MKKLMLVFALMSVSLASLAAGFVHPLQFDGSEAMKNQVVQYIEQRVKTTYCEGQIDLCQPTTLRMMERENLKAFKELTTATNSPVMENVIQTYCDGMIDMCDYTTILMMYRENDKSSKEKLTW